MLFDWYLLYVHNHFSRATFFRETAVEGVFQWGGLHEGDELYEFHEWGGIEWGWAHEVVGLHGLFALQIVSYPSAHFLRLHVRLYYIMRHISTLAHIPYTFIVQSIFKNMKKGKKQVSNISFFLFES